MHVDEYRAAFAPDAPDTPDWQPAGRGAPPAPEAETVLSPGGTVEARDGLMRATVSRRRGPWGRTIALTVQNTRLGPITVWVTPLQAELLGEGLLSLAETDQ